TLSQSIDDLSGAQRMHKQAEAYATRAQQLSEPVAGLRVRAAQLAVLRRQGIEVGVDQEQISGLRAQLARSDAQYRLDPETILSADGVRRFAFWQALSDLPPKLHGALQD